MSIQYLDYADYNNGWQAIVAFHNEMVKQWPEQYKISKEQLIEGLQLRKGQKYFLDGLGLGITEAGLSPSQVRSAMKTMVSKTGGKVPTSNSAFTTALIDESQVFSLIDSSTFTMVESAKNVIQGVTYVGQGVIDTGKGIVDSTVSISNNLKWILPVILFIGVGAYVYNYTK